MVLNLEIKELKFKINNLDLIKRVNLQSFILNFKIIFKCKLWDYNSVVHNLNPLLLK